jgi:Hint domain
MIEAAMADPQMWAMGDTHPPCFTPGTRIATPGGARVIDDLTPGDAITTTHGPQPLVWLGRLQVNAAQARTAAFRPIRLRAGALGNGLPQRDMLVSPQHRFVLSGWRAEMLFGESSVLVAAKHLVNDLTIRPVDVGTVTYLHLLLPAHHIIIAEGALTESLHPSHVGQMAETALPCLTAREARLISGAGGGT